MAKAKRKKGLRGTAQKGFRGTPEEHAKRAEEWESGATKMLRGAVTALQKGACRDAKVFIDIAKENIGAAFAERSWTNTGNARRLQLRKVLKAIDKKFDVRCACKK